MNRRQAIALLLTVPLFTVTKTPSAFSQEIEIEVEQEKVLILAYHHLSETMQSCSTIHPHDFEEHLRVLQNNHCNIIHFKDFCRWIEEDDFALPSKSVLITFDDGYASFYEKAFPLLQQYNYPSTQFIIVDQIDKEVPDAIPKLSWEQINELEATNLVEIQSHSYDAHYFDNGQARLVTMTEEELHVDFFRARHYIRFHMNQHINKRVHAISYPFGIYNQKVVEAAQHTSYQFGFTSNGSYVIKNQTNTLEIPRISADNLTAAQVEELLGDL
ncbi:polysaccharide deacetylase family protein [Heliorestis convoluta]|uniref:Polysaccharide deacetylase family protein n=1 Tax=Heliorestis convoluta TaxID=356322 RepID=A0A5Q2MW67_9FIRM|nr:polysaccharide deacetylase family protein [Heliorestis convoluta]QGG46644.1 polysaccharide deacetylase family protein [Heliorestis convoluta]